MWLFQDLQTTATLIGRLDSLRGAIDSCACNLGCLLFVKGKLEVDFIWRYRLQRWQLIRLLTGLKKLRG